MKRILITDDDEQNLFMLESLFKGHSYQTTLAHNGEEALFEARENPPDLIISDILMPVLDGFSLCRAWQLDENLKHIPFVFYTATYTDTKDEEFALSIGADMFIVKPTEPREFLHMVENVLRHIDKNSFSSVQEAPLAEEVFLKEYSETLIRKLENKTIQLKQTNRSLKQEIKKRLKIEKKLKSHLKNSQQILRTTLDGFLLVDHEGKILSANPSYCEMTGYSEKELMQMNLAQLVAPVYRKKLPRQIGKIFHEGKAQFVGEHVCKNNQRINVDVSTMLIEWENKKVIAAFLRDVTAQKRTEHQLVEREELYRILVETIPYGVRENDLNGKITFSNRAYNHMHGYDEGEITGMYIWDFKKTEKEKTDLQQYFKYLVQKQIKPERFISQNVRKDGSIFDVEVDWAFKRDSLGRHTGFISVITDVTDKKKLEEQLRQSQKMEAIGQLTGGIAHDFNNILTIINGYSDLMLAKLRRDDPSFEPVQQIKEAAYRASSLTSQLLAFSRKQILNPVILDLNHLIRQMEKMLRRLIGEDIDLRTIYDDNISTIKADSSQIEQVILNLAVNARDAMPRGGKLIIETAMVNFTEEYVRLHEDVSEGRFVMMAVSDTGTGIDEATKPRIFEPFFTTKEKERGTGLGLSTVYGIVKQSGGSIWVYSEPGKGTIFKVYFPAVKKGSATKAEQKELLRLHSDETILVVEDDEGVRNLVVITLKKYGYQPIVAANGAEALKKVDEFRGRIDLLLTDVIMPKIGGSELSDSLVKKLPNLKVLFMSGYTDKSIIDHGVLQKGIHFIQKPFSPEALIRKLRQVFDENTT